MKKGLIILAITFTLIVGTVVAYADSDISAMNSPWRHNNSLSEISREELLKERAEFREEEIKKALEEGRITESEAKEWEEHFKYMDEFHDRNGYLNGRRGCGRGSATINMGYRGMMRGNRY